ncbi:MAG: phosphoribosyl-ATP diphosphatase [Fimbriimonadales bacterium]|nr:phosphoribosyl-ATP diphosphatase [Fimbriimonadales bacterium]
MIVPSVDVMSGRAVQLIGGERLAIDAGDPFAVAERFSVAGEIAVIDLDAALSTGSNAQLIEKIVMRFPCRVGGGIRDIESALRWLDMGAQKIIIGTRATPEFLSQLPRDRVIAAVDARHGDVAVEGWTKQTGSSVIDRIASLSPFVSGFLVTSIDREGRMEGYDRDMAEAAVAAAKGTRVTIAGGVTTPNDIAELDSIGADAQVGMALYTGELKLEEAIASVLKSDRPDGLWPTVVVDERGIALGLAYSSVDSLREAVVNRKGVYQSRTRGLWTKGSTSGATQELIRIDVDCDRDSLRFTVNQSGSGFCHLGTRTCWGEDRGIARLAKTIELRLLDAPAGSYTRRLFEDRSLLGAKVLEEAAELVNAKTIEDTAEEAADLLYFLLIKSRANGVDLSMIEDILDRRSLKVIRRGGNKKL